MNVLIAEDEVRLANAIAQILRENKYQVDVTYNGKDALAYVTGADYDVFVCDVMLPGMDGFQIVHEARKQGVSTPIIMLTARTSLSDKVTGLDAGADDYLTKPFQPAELMARLRALTRRQGELVVDEQTAGDLKLGLSTSELSCNGKTVSAQEAQVPGVKRADRDAAQVGVPSRGPRGRVGCEKDAQEIQTTLHPHHHGARGYRVVYRLCGSGVQ